MKKNIFTLVLSFILATLITVTALTGCSTDTGTSSATSELSQSAQTSSADTVDTSSEAQDVSNDDENVVGEGETSFTFEVTDDEGAVTTFTVLTDAQTVGQALLDADLIEGEESTYGLYVRVVNGITADYDTDGAYWAFYVDGSYALSGVDTTDIEPGKVYSFVYTTD